MLTIDALKNNVLASVQFSCPGNSKKVGMEDIEIDADKSCLKLSKELLRSPELKAIRKQMGLFKKFLKSRAVPGNFFRTGCYLVDKFLVPDVHARFILTRQSVAAAVEQFLGMYDQRQAEAQQRLKHLYDPEDYPSAQAFRDATGVKLALVRFSTPDDLDPAIVAEQAESAEAELKSQVEEIRMALRESMAGIIGHLVERLEPDEEGKRKIVKQASFDRLAEFLEFFEKRDITNDEKMLELVGQARAVMQNADVQIIKQDNAYRVTLKGQLAEVQAKVTAMVQEQRTRLLTISADDDVPPAEEAEPASEAVPAAEGYEVPSEETWVLDISDSP